MCGIAGIYRSGEASNDLPIVTSMMTKLEQRGPDGNGTYQDGAVTFGHQRLKIIDLTDAAKQPMVSRCGRFVINFNGEVYNFQDIRAELGIKPEELRSTSDTEVLLEAWAAWGPDVLPRIAGQFAFAIYDRLEKRLWLARDRFGEKPLFYHVDRKTLTFASNLGSLVMAPHVPRELDPEAMQEFATLRYVVAPRTILRGVKKLLPGGLLRFDSNGLEIRTWYDFHYHSKENAPAKIDKAKLAEEFDELFRQAVRRCLVSDVPVGLLLSDGIDSNAILAVLDQMGLKTPCFTFKTYSTPAELAQNIGLVGPAGLPTTECPFSAAERVQNMKPAFASLNEPIGDGSSLATWLLLRSASKHAKVFLCGHGSDELLGGYRLSQDRFRLRAISCLANLPAGIIGTPVDRFFFGAEPLQTKLHSVRKASFLDLPTCGRYLIHRPLPVDDLCELKGADRKNLPDTYLQVVRELYGRCQPSADDMDRIQKVMLHTFLSENILSFADAVAMDSSVELRMPFLDRDLANFILNLPSRARVGLLPIHGNTKLILRWWGMSNMNRETVTRRKCTFSFGSLRPLMKSHGSELRSYILDSSPIRSIFPGIESWMSHSPEYYRDSRQNSLWALLALGIWCDAHNIQAS